MNKKIICIKQLEVMDEQERFELGKSIRGSLMVDGESGKATFTPDKVNVQSKELKKQPTKVYDGPMTGVKSTIKVDGKMLTHMEMSRKKAEQVGRSIAETELLMAFNEGWKELMAS